MRNRDAHLDYEATRALHLMSFEEGFITAARYEDYADATYRKLERAVGTGVAALSTDHIIECLEGSMAWSEQLGHYNDREVAA